MDKEDNISSVPSSGSSFQTQQPRMTVSSMSDLLHSPPIQIGGLNQQQIPVNNQQSSSVNRVSQDQVHVQPPSSSFVQQQQQFFTYPPFPQDQQLRQPGGMQSPNTQQRLPQPIFATRMTSQPQQMSPNFTGQMRIPLPSHRFPQPGQQASVSGSNPEIQFSDGPINPMASGIRSASIVPPMGHPDAVSQQQMGGAQPQMVHFRNPSEGSVPRHPGVGGDLLNSSSDNNKPPAKPKPKKKKPAQPKNPPAGSLASTSVVPNLNELTFATAQAPVVQPPKPKSRKKPSQPGGAPKKLSETARKAQEEELKYNRKHQLLKRCVKALVFKNAALCDEVARLNQRIHTVVEERKVLLKRIFHHERLKQKKIVAAQKRQAAQALKAEEAKAAATTSIVSSS